MSATPESLSEAARRRLTHLLASIQSRRKIAAEQPSSPLFQLWAQADDRVPQPFLFSLQTELNPDQTTSAPVRPKTTHFVYAIGNQFVAQVTATDDKFGVVELHRRNLGFRLMPIHGRQMLLIPELGLAKLTAHLAAQPSPGKERKWRTLRLSRPLSPGTTEPLYHFRPVDGSTEFRVGAQTGAIYGEFPATTDEGSAKAT